MRRTCWLTDTISRGLCAIQPPKLAHAAYMMTFVMPLLPVELQVAAIDGEILLVSQFTLYGRLKKPKPDYSKAMGPDQVG